jgi:hypothetical protein
MVKFSWSGHPFLALRALLGTRRQIHCANEVEANSNFFPFHGPLQVLVKHSVGIELLIQYLRFPLVCVWSFVRVTGNVAK